MVLRGVTLWFSFHGIPSRLPSRISSRRHPLLAMGERSGESNHGKRVALVQYHAYMQTFTFVLMTIGFVVIYINKENNNRPHFTTIHSWVGSAALGLYYLNFFFASVKTYGGKTNWQWKDTGHRASGTLAFLTRRCYLRVVQRMGPSQLGSSRTTHCKCSRWPFAHHDRHLLAQLEEANDQARVEIDCHVNTIFCVEESSCLSLYLDQTACFSTYTVDSLSKVRKNLCTYKK
ncbi:hypothetical protein Ae201684P_012073 [Aphanomyces euteiches]|nr:hypothetical protein Ae201684P_012073 [Aphanomyces euteiches]